MFWRFLPSFSARLYRKITAYIIDKTFVLPYNKRNKRVKMHNYFIWIAQEIFNMHRLEVFHKQEKNLKENREVIQ